MDDQTWESIAAELDAQDGTSAQPSPAEASPETLGLQETASSPDANESEVLVAETPQVAETETVPVSDVETLRVELERKQQDIAAREAEWQQRVQAAEQMLRQAEAEKFRKLEQEDAERAEQFYNDLQATDPEWAEQFQERRNYLAWDRERARREAAGSYSALEALTLAVEYNAPDLMQRIIADASELTQYPQLEQKQKLLGARKQATASESAKVQQLERELQEMRNRLEAMNRPAAADIVEGGRSGSGSGNWQQRWDNATGFDEAFSVLEETLRR